MTRTAPGTEGAESSVVRVFSQSGTVVGAGFVIAPGLVATCAHVISDALGLDPADARQPATAVAIDFPLRSPRTFVSARVTHWAPITATGAGDVAVLELSEPVPETVAAPPFWRADEPWGREFRMLGFPIEHDDGVWVAGEFRAPQGVGWLQLQAAPGGQPITAGFSGAAVWDAGSAAVVGMAVASDRRRYTGTAFMIPIAEVLGIDPTLLPNPYRGLERFGENDAHLFFGRDADIERVLAAVDRRAVVAVAGVSGTGKSSLVNAGVIPRLRRNGWRVAAFRLTGDGSARVAEAGKSDDALTVAVTELAERVAQQSVDPASAAAEFAGRIPAEGLVICPDQFEDVAATAPESARALLRWLAELVAAADRAGGRLRVVLTLRWEALNELVDDDLAHLLDGATVALAPMGRAQLRDVVRGPAAHAPGAELDPELVERLVDDTADEPGGLPLLESMLTELWEQRSGGRLTLADYRRTGQVGGSITRRAERALAGFGEAETVEAAWRLLLMLAVPAATGDGFVRSVASLRDFPELRSVAGQLARDRLIVVGRRSDGTETAELAHQALIDNWPQLRERLERDRDFRAWRQRVDGERRNWEATQRDTGALLRGSALSTAEEWLAGRSGDIPAADRSFIQASRRMRRREVRRWRAVTAVVAVLALVAATTAVLAYRSSLQRAEQLRLSAGISLAQESIRIADRDPLRALQFAQAAARNAPGRPEIEAALLRQQVSWAGVDSFSPGPWSAPNHLATDKEGTEFLVGGKDGTATIWTDVLSGSPKSWALPVPASTHLTAAALSADGSRAALITDNGEITVWWPHERRGPATIREPGTAGGEWSTMAAFSDDGSRLVISTDPGRGDTHTNRPDLVEVYDTSTAHPIRLSVFSTGEPTDVLPRHVDRAAVWFVEQTAETGPVNVLRDIASGAVLRRLPRGKGGSIGAIIGCTTAPADGPYSDFVVSDPEDGSVRTRIPGTVGDLRDRGRRSDSALRDDDGFGRGRRIRHELRGRPAHRRTVPLPTVARDAARRLRHPSHRGRSRGGRGVPHRVAAVQAGHPNRKPQPIQRTSPR
ncbi:nSTAND1 domain-containing NTPase [Nocardia veterana]|uniref:Novel STAND NTPase 1 domain-containing protein n=1 Tax=Nocardia veterana TaxID=132249 RepID=A0A7X6M0U9_9NOCA|nr:trypsin-like peptidase domain-containing protein [Nocardia veterana]NKY88158.1 hypothetical protein [Nocardia veterana]